MLKLTANPTFWADVQIPVAGEKNPVKVAIKFKHKTADEYRAFLEKTKDMEEHEVVLDMAEDWSHIDGAFNPDNVKTICQNYHSFALACFNKYTEEYAKARVKN